MGWLSKQTPLNSRRRSCTPPADVPWHLQCQHHHQEPPLLLTMGASSLRVCMRPFLKLGLSVAGQRAPQPAGPARRHASLACPRSSTAGSRSSRCVGGVRNWAASLGRRKLRAATTATRSSPGAPGAFQLTHSSVSCAVPKYIRLTYSSLVNLWMTPEGCIHSGPFTCRQTKHQFWGSLPVQAGKEGL